jgi:hypothetical protein
MHVRRERKRLHGDRQRTYVSLAHNVWGMSKKGGKKQPRPVVFARLGAEEDLDVNVVRGMRSALDKLLLQLMARDGAKGSPQNNQTFWCAESGRRIDFSRHYSSRAIEIDQAGS